jgi:hypothetical protein
LPQAPPIRTLLPATLRAGSAATLGLLGEARTPTHHARAVCSVPLLPLPFHPCHVTPAACGGLPVTVRDQIRVEAEGQLETIVDGVLGSVIGASRGMPLPADVSPALATQFQALLMAAPGTAAAPRDIAVFCNAVLAVSVASVARV